MKKNFSLQFIPIFIFLLALACRGGATMPVLTPTLVIATKIPSTITPTLLPSETPTLQPSPTPRGPLSVVNAPQMESLIRFGHGTINELALHPDGTVLAVASHVGLWLYEMETLSPTQFLDNPISRVESVAWSPNGLLLAYGGQNGTVLVWDVNNEMLIQTLMSHSDTVASIAWAPDGKQLATGSIDGKVLVWDVANWQIVKTLENYLDQVTGVSWSPVDGRLAFGGSKEFIGGIWLWRPDTDEVESIFDWDGQVSRIHWSPDGHMLVFTWDEPCMGGSCRSVLTLEVASGEARILYGGNGYTYSFNSSAWSPDGSQLALGSYRDSIGILDISTQEYTVELAGPRQTSEINHLVWTPDASRLIAGSDEGEIRVWDITKLETIIRMDEHNSVSGVSWSPNGSQLAYERRNEVHIWDAAMGETVQVLTHEEDVQSFSWSPDGSQVVTKSALSSEGYPVFRIYEVTSGEIVKFWEEQVNWWAGNLAWSPSGGRIVASGYIGGGEGDPVHGSMIGWNPETGEYAAYLEIHAFGLRHSWSPDARMLALIAEDKVHLWEASGGKVTRILEGATDWVRSFAWSPDSTRFAGADWNGEIIIWNTATGEIEHELEGHDNVVEGVAWSPDGVMLATGSWDSEIRLWDMNNGNLLTTLSGHLVSVESLAWSLDGSFLASGGEDGTIHIWSMPDGALLHTLAGHGSRVYTLVFSPDGRFLASESADGTVQVWGVGALQTP